MGKSRTVSQKLNLKPSWVNERACHMWSGERHFSPSLPGDRYLKLSSEKRSPGRNLREHRLVRRSGTTFLVFSLRMRSFPEFLAMWVGKHIRVGSTNYKSFSRAGFFSLLVTPCLRCLRFSRSYNLRLFAKQLKTSKIWKLKEQNKNRTFTSFSRHPENTPAKPPGSATCILFASYWFTLS